MSRGITLASVGGRISISVDGECASALESNFGGAVHGPEVGSLVLHLMRVSAFPISWLSLGDLIEGQREGDRVMKWV